ncbi:MAG: aromatic acid exporter family protein [Turicibacter sp.]
MNKIVGLRTWKTAIGSILSIYIAQILGLNFSLSAGIITILSVQNTKKKSIDLALQRMGSTALALGIACLIFTVFGFTPFSFGIYLLCFIPLAVKFGFTDGIVPSSVLVTHILGEQVISGSLLLNECLLMLIGAGVGILANLYMPKMEDEIKEMQIEIEEQFKVVLLYLARTIRSQTVYLDEENLFNQLNSKLEKGKVKSYQNSENVMIEQMTYYVKYMEMRSHQFQILQNMRLVIGKVNMTSTQSECLATLTEKVAFALHECNCAVDLVNQTEAVLETIRLQSLPQSREEFENRALLFQYLNELRYLLEIKRNFRTSLTNEQLVKFGCTNV